jgi:hypothetical protein
MVELLPIYASWSLQVILGSWEILGRNLRLYKKKPVS